MDYDIIIIIIFIIIIVIVVIIIIIIIRLLFLTLSKIKCWIYKHNIGLLSFWLMNSLTSASKVLRKGDVLLSIDGIRVANDGTIPFRAGSFKERFLDFLLWNWFHKYSNIVTPFLFCRVQLNYYFTQRFSSDNVTLAILRLELVHCFLSAYKSFLLGVGKVNGWRWICRCGCRSIWFREHFCKTTISTRPPTLAQDATDPS